MKSKKTSQLSNIWFIIKNITASNRFLIFILIMFVIQCLWVAISFKYPMIFDERYHIEVSKIFSKQWSPIITHQNQLYDVYGDLTFGSASLYHFLLGLVLRIADFFHTTLITQVIILRVINILFVTAGLYIFADVFRRVGFPKQIINTALLFFCTIPLFILVSATVSYDNLLFLLVPIYLRYSIAIIQSNKISTVLILKVILVGMIASLVKFSFLPIFAIGIFVLLIFLIRRSGGLKQFLNSIYESFYSQMNSGTVLIILALIFGSLFSFRYLYPIVRYHTPIPSCQTVLQENRCEKSGVFLSEKNARQTKQERTPKSIQAYTKNWSETILLQLDTSAAVVSEGKSEFGRRLPLNAPLLTVSSVGGLLILVYAWKLFTRTSSQRFLVGIAICMVGVLFLFNVLSYYSVNQDLNVQTRYLLIPILLLLTFSLYAINHLLSDKYKVKLAGLCLVLVFASQGGGVVKHILTSQDDWYRQEKSIIQINEAAKNIMSPIVKE